MYLLSNICSDKTDVIKTIFVPGCNYIKRNLK